MLILFFPASCTSFTEMAPSAVVIQRYDFPSEMIEPGALPDSLPDRSFASLRMTGSAE